MIRTLFGKDSKGNIKVWGVAVEGNKVLVSHGRLDGKLQVKTTVCTPKNVGRANETSGEAQALLEADSKYKKQMDKLYRPTIEELNTVGNDLPMLAHDYTKVGHRMTFPLYVSRKLDGVRCLASVTEDGDVVLTSRGGKTYPTPDHVREDLIELSIRTGITLFDGELYCHGMPLPMIISAVKKPGKLTGELKFYIFDLPITDQPWLERMLKLELMPVQGLSSIKIVGNGLVACEAECHAWLHTFMQEGYEGIMLRSPEGLYKFNHRSADLMKWKEFQDTEVKVEFVEMDKNGEGVLNCVMKDSRTRVKCKMRGDHEFRSYENQKKLVSSWITLRYQQLTPDGVPQFPVGICVRDCDSKGNPTI